MPAKVALNVFPNTATLFSIAAISTKTFAQTLNVAIIDSEGVTSGPYRILPNTGPMQYVVSMSTSASLAPGTHSGNFGVRVCFDDPLVCNQPVEGSPWAVPYTITVADPASLSYQRWDPGQQAPGFIDNFAISEAGGKPYVIAAGFYSGVMEAWTSADLGLNWTLQTSAGSPPPLVAGFALASDGDGIYLSGGQSIGTYGHPLGTYPGEVWRFDGSAWQSKTSSAAFAGRQNHVMAKVGNRLYIAGGSNGGGALQDVWASDDDGSNWSKIADTLPAIGTVTCALNWQNSLLLIGQKFATSTDGIHWATYTPDPSIFPSGSKQCGIQNGRLFVNALDLNANAASTADLQHWQIEHAARGTPSPGMASVDGHLLVATGSGTSQRIVYRSMP